MKNKISPDSSEFIAELEDVQKRMREWGSSSQCIVFPIITDLHSGLVTEDPLNSQKRETASHIRLLNRAAEMLHADFTANLGDTGLDVPLKTQGETETLMRRIAEFHAESALPVLFTLGNHDDLNGKVPPQRWNELFAKINAKHKMTVGGDGSYGFYDVPGKNSRIFRINTNETDKISDDQLEFLKKNLDSMPRERCAVILQHFIAHPAGFWKRPANLPPHQLAPQHIKYNELLHDFVKNGGTLAAVIAGDSHYDSYVKEDGINRFTIQGYGGIAPHEKPEHARVSHEYNPLMGRSDSFDSSRTCLLELAVLDPGKRRLKLFRMGAGGNACDREAVW